MSIILFKVIQFTVIVTFAVFISDIRKKRGMVPLTNRKLLIAMKTGYLIPLVIYAYIIITLDQILFSDYIAVILVSLGTVVTGMAKINLGKYHTWSGYCSTKNIFVYKGIYRFIRHPLYAGIYLFIFGAISTIIQHEPWYFTMITLMILACIMVFIAIMAGRETRHLSQKLGVEYLAYRERVHPFLPLRRYAVKASYFEQSGE